MVSGTCHVRYVGRKWLDLVHVCIANTSIVLPPADTRLLTNFTRQCIQGNQTHSSAACQHVEIPN